MNGEESQLSGPRAFFEQVIQGSRQRPVVLVNGDTFEAINPLCDKLARIIGEIDPSIRSFSAENVTLANVEHEGMGGLFLPLGVSLWWQGELVGALLSDHAHSQLRQLVLAASSRPPLEVINEMLRHVHNRQHHFFHRAALPEIQPWVSLFLVNCHDAERVRQPSDSMDVQLVEIVRPVWLKNSTAGVLFISRNTSKPTDLSLKFASFDQRGEWLISKTLTVAADLIIDRKDSVVQNLQVAREDREFLTYTLRSGEQTVEFSIYKLSSDAAALERALQSIAAPSDEDAPLGERSAVLREAMQELDDLVGLENLKMELRSYANFIEVMQQRRQAGVKTADIATHFVFKGSPGTGKTTVARIIGRILFGYGLLEKGQIVEVDRSGLVAQFMGQTASKTTEAFKKALDGVLFIDEAYTLTPGDQVGQDYGAEAVAILMTLMENNRGKISVIVAGYPEKMEQFLRSNPGLRSRFSKVFHFDDYSPSELADVFSRMAEADGYELDVGVIQVVTRHFVAAKTQEGFGNARAARQLMEDTKVRHANRVAALESQTPADLNLLKVEDVVPKTQSGGGFEINEEGLANVLAELDSLVGLADVKLQILSLVNLCRVQIRRQQKGHQVQSQALNFAFVGNPGTGKTTVARLLGRIFAHLGLLSRGHLVEVSRSHLVAGYVGQTAIKTRGQVDRSLDGVLFIDEAYALSRSQDMEGSNDFGAEAIEQILLALENERHRLSIVMAGYTEPMNRFLSSNPGLRSRVSNIIRFPDYSSEELVKVFDRFLKDNGYRLAENAYPLLIGYFRTLQRGETFGNARAARQFFEVMQRTHASRIASTASLSEDDLILFTDHDLLVAVGNTMGVSTTRGSTREGYL